MKCSRFSTTAFSLIWILMLLLSCATGYNRPADNYYEEGFLFFKKMEYGRSIESFSKVLELAPDGNQNFRVYYNRGMAYFKNRRYDKAIYDFTMAIESAPRKDKKFARESYEWRGNAYQKNNNQDLAILDYSQALRLKPNHENSKHIYNNMAWCWLSKGDFDNAIKNFNQAIISEHALFTPGFSNSVCK